MRSDVCICTCSQPSIVDVRKIIREGDRSDMHEMI